MDVPGNDQWFWLYFKGVSRVILKMTMTTKKNSNKNYTQINIINKWGLSPVSGYA